MRPSSGALRVHAVDGRGRARIARVGELPDDVPDTLRRRVRSGDRERIGGAPPMPTPPLRRTTVEMLSVPIYQSLFVPPDSAMSSRRGGPPMIDSSWWSDARCNDSSGTLGPIFFSHELRDIVEAKPLAGCPVIAPCLEGRCNGANLGGSGEDSCSTAAGSFAISAPPGGRASTPAQTTSTWRYLFRRSCESSPGELW